MFNYPPFPFGIQVELRHVDEVVLRNAANELARLLDGNGWNVGYAARQNRMCSRVRKMYRIQIL